VPGDCWWRGVQRNYRKNWTPRCGWRRS